MALTKFKLRRTQPINNPVRLVVADTKVVYSGSYAAARGKKHEVVLAGGASTGGKVVAFERKPGILPLGYFDTPAGDEPERTGDAGKLTGNGVKDTLVDIGGCVLMDQLVSGSSSDLAVFEPVYASDDDVLTVTPPATSQIQNGIILSRRGAATTESLVMMFSAEQMIGQSLAGGTKKDVYLGYFAWGATIDAIIADGIIAHNHAEMVNLFAIIDVPTVGAAGTTSIVVTIDDTPIAIVPDGIVPVSSLGVVIPTASARGVRINAVLNGTKVTYHAGFELNVKAINTSGTLTSGAYHLWMTVINKPSL